MANIDKVQLPDGTQYNLQDTTSQYATETYVQQQVATINKQTIGLGNVDNTSDLNKPISTATQTALDGKVSKSDMDWKSATVQGSYYVTGSSNFPIPEGAKELNLQVELHDGTNTIGYILFNINTTILRNNEKNFFSGETVYGSGMKRYTRAAALKITSTYASMGEVFYAGGFDSSTIDTNLLSTSRLYMQYR